MGTLLDIGLLLLGGVMLYYGAEWLVRGAAGLARAFGVPPLVVGLTVVSYGTSAPELSVSLVAALEDTPAISLGNVVGSNIANVGLILGITALMAPPLVDGSLVRRELPILWAASLALPLTLLDDVISRIEGGVLFLGALLFTVATLFWFQFRPRTSEPPGGEHAGKLVLVSLFALGLAVLIGGGKAFVSGAVGLAATFGVSERTIGLTVVAIGTSLPELAASVVAAARGHSEIAVGNVIGSNLFNILLILGVTSLVHPLAGNLMEMRLDLAVMLGLTLLMTISMRKERRIGRREGIVYCTSYAAFVIALVVLR